MKATINEVPKAVSTERITSSISEAMTNLGRLASEEGYEEFIPGAEELEPGSASSPTDMQQIRNNLAELKALMEQVRALFDKKLNAPVVKSWMEAR